jgi:hypothetical protein
MAPTRWLTKLVQKGTSFKASICHKAACVAPAVARMTDCGRNRRERLRARVGEPDKRRRLWPVPRLDFLEQRSCFFVGLLRLFGIRARARVGTVEVEVIGICAPRAKARRVALLSHGFGLGQRYASARSYETRRCFIASTLPPSRGVVQ